MQVIDMKNCMLYFWLYFWHGALYFGFFSFQIIYSFNIFLWIQIYSISIFTFVLDNAAAATTVNNFVDDIRRAAEQAQNLNGFVYEPTSGLYYDQKTGYYYNAVMLRNHNKCYKN